MKTSILFIAALFLNTSLLLAEPMAFLAQGLNTWFFIGIEVVLLIGYYAYKTVKDLHEACELDLGDLNVFVFTDPNKKNKGKN